MIASEKTAGILKNTRTQGIGKNVIARKNKSERPDSFSA